MQASVGDRLIVMSRSVAGKQRIGVIVEVHGNEGEPPYVVRWEDADHTAVVVPGPDAHVEHAG
ncbi:MULTISPECIES: DUF1918 domain-containing protein [unclassified Leifsonia]|jgi:ribosomal protein L35AE/L33A|uniref:DUF1918 domain-containing protein n=1 Tax=unclassified Leifsonia TaxID=2663824 RepID=UPI0008A7D326|nr:MULTISPECIES: DUF1918 domain-containing protein [unclassified Leifsonia]SEI16561.1 protein of unknown function [Leifsonia sp. CL154]SFM07454.1 protein of unknown function [Leifsonia sp. CL147]HWU47101.1 DUF1918 domain-containing protein [Humibacter sp.]